MNFFSDRLSLVREYGKWLEENPTVKDSPLSLIGFLEGFGYLKNIKEVREQKESEEEE